MSNARNASITVMTSTMMLMGRSVGKTTREERLPLAGTVDGGPPPFSAGSTGLEAGPG